VHWQNGVFVSSNGIEHTVIFAASAFALAVTGPGVLSLDAVLGLDTFWTTSMAWIAIVVGITGGILNLAVRRPAAPTQSTN
jgi:putative oxidoreductase